MSESITIRKATLRDADGIAARNRNLAMETEARKLDPQTVLRGVKAVLKDPHKGFYLLAEMPGAAPAVVGQLRVTGEWSDWRNGNFWWIQSVYVDPAHRGRRIFSTLFHTLQELARFEKHVVGLRLYVDQSNAQAREIVEYLGLAPGSHVMYEEEF